MTEVAVYYYYYYYCTHLPLCWWRFGFRSKRTHLIANPVPLPQLFSRFFTFLLSCSVSSVCRICHDGADAGKLVSPCKCCGTMALVHLPCMERWLSAANSNSCEICGHQFVTQRTNRTFIEVKLSTTVMLRWEFRQIIFYIDLNVSILSRCQTS